MEFRPWRTAASSALQRRQRDARGYRSRLRDQGAGIPPEVRDKVFNLYFTTKKTGSGIGLAMSYRVLQLHNGAIDFVTEMGRGTTFRLVLPLARRQRDGKRGCHNANVSAASPRHSR